MIAQIVVRFTRNNFIGYFHEPTINEFDED